jgi:hypothetical protein
MDFGELCLGIARIAKVSRRCATTRIADQTKCDNFVEPKARAVTLNFDAARRVRVEPDWSNKVLADNVIFHGKSAI